MGDRCQCCLYYSNYFQCSPAECIKKHLVCNGVYDCVNEADETKELCQNETCGKRSFQCEYGACISNFNKCNDQIDCVDSSDETFILCGKVPQIATTKTAPPL